MQSLATAQVQGPGCSLTSRTVQSAPPKITRASGGAGDAESPRVPSAQSPRAVPRVPEQFPWAPQPLPTTRRPRARRERTRRAVRGRDASLLLCGAGERSAALRGDPARDKHLHESHSPHAPRSRRILGPDPADRKRGGRGRGLGGGGAGPGGGGGHVGACGIVVLETGSGSGNVSKCGVNRVPSVRLVCVCVCVCVIKTS